MPGKFITLEGIDGAGKTTHLAWLADLLRKRGNTVTVTREPGGTPLGERLRELLLDSAQRLHPATETLMVFAARREHLDKVILPALRAGNWVLCDRFTDATFAYQGGGSGVSWEHIAALERWVQGDLQPDITILLDVPSTLGHARSRRVRPPDRFEQEQEAFHKRVREAYLRRAREHPARIRIVDARGSVSEVQGRLEELILSI
ncbi:MAG TPA: dTMP kinase [Burkholderiales bacterium]|nr:dTMP kinase [Burkholderiales bacterium]